MGENGFENFLADLIIRGVPPKYAVNIAKYFQPDWFTYSDDKETMNVIDIWCGYSFPDNWYRLQKQLYPDKCESCDREDYYIPPECSPCKYDWERDCNDCEIGKKIKSPCETCEHNGKNKNNHERENLKTINYIKDNNLAKATKIYVDNSNMLYSSNSFSLFEDSSNKKKEILYSSWYMVDAFLCIRPGVDILVEMPTLFMASCRGHDKRATWLNYLTTHCGYIHKNLPTDILRGEKKEINQHEDQMIKDAIKKDFFQQSIDHFIICTGDGNSKDGGETFLDIALQILKTKNKLTIYSFSKNIHKGYKKLQKNYEQMQIIYPDISHISWICKANSIQNELP